VRHGPASGQAELDTDPLQQLEQLIALGLAELRAQIELEPGGERHHATRRDLQALADRLLGLALGRTDRAPQGELAR